MNIAMTLTLIEVGDEYGVIIPDEYLERLGVDVGDELEITISKAETTAANSEKE